MTTAVHVELTLPRLGRVTVAATGNGICGLSFRDIADGFDFASVPGKSPLLTAATKQLTAYDAGKRREFDLPFDILNCTPFTRAVLDACARIPYGEVLTYGQMAEAIGKPGAARAVGGALGRNPLAVFIPCHRVVAGNGIGGFTSGLHNKRRLWTIEGITLRSSAPPAPRAVPRVVRRG